jgi:rubredoxin
MRYRKFICNVCGHVYDEALGDAAAGLAAGTRGRTSQLGCPDPERRKTPLVRRRRS